MQNNIKMISDVEINQCLSKLNEVFRSYLPNVEEEEIAKIINLVRCGINVSLKQTSICDVDLRWFLGALTIEQYSKYNLTEEQIEEIKNVVASSTILTKIGSFANEQKEKIGTIVPQVALTIARHKIELRDADNNYLYSSDNSLKGKNK